MILYQTRAPLSASAQGRERVNLVTHFSLIPDRPFGKLCIFSEGGW